jgi:hypothetical protein
MAIWAIGVCLLLLAGINVILYNHAYHFTHFSPAGTPKTARPEQLSFGEKLSLAFTGVRNPKPVNVIRPRQPFRVVHLQNERNNRLEGWLMETEGAAGTVVLFHGYTSTKSQLLTEAEAFRELGYHTLLVDLSGHGGSGGHVTTIGYHEAADVAAAYGYARERDPASSCTVFRWGPRPFCGLCPRMGCAPTLWCSNARLPPCCKPRGTASVSCTCLSTRWPNCWCSGAAGRTTTTPPATTPPTTPGGYGAHAAHVRAARPAGHQARGGSHLPQPRGPKELVYFKDLEHQSYCKKEPHRWRAAVNRFLRPNKALKNHYAMTFEDLN